MMQINNIPIYESYGDEKSIALLDNSVIGFMNQLSYAGHIPEVVLNNYDVILIPQWVMEEVKDAEHRMHYIEGLIEKGFPIKIIPETLYGTLIDEKEIDLYHIVHAAVSRIGVMLKYMRQNVEKPDLLDLDSYEAWIQKLYDNWPIESEHTSSGRQKKKNAGEISLTILAEIFSWNFSEIDTLTVYTHDRDSYDFQKNAEERLKEYYKDRSPISVSYKSNDAILCQLYRLNELDQEQIRTIRRNERIVTYTQRREDDAVTLEVRNKNSEEFIQLIEDDSVQIIF